VELSASELLVATQRDGILYIRLSPDGSRIDEQRKLQEADGIRYGAIARAAVSTRNDGGVMASTAAGLYRWTGKRFERLQIEGLDGDESGVHTVLEFAAAPDGSEWAFGEDRIYHRHDQVAWHAAAIEAILNGFVECVAFDHDGSVLFGGASLILRYDRALAPTLAPSPGVRLRSIEKIGPDSERRWLDLAPATPPAFTQGDFSIAFRFAAPEYQAPHTIEYSARLIGHDDQFQDWRSSTLYTYRHLEPGDYSFSIRARDRRGSVSQIDVGHFSILPPWYARRGLLLLWAILLTILLAGIVAAAAAWRTRRLRATAAHLERMVAERTNELESANRRLHDMAHLDGLTAVANRRRLDDWLQQAWTHCREHGRPLAVMIIDVDHFKSYNDRMGHLAGDELLKQIVEALSNSLRRAEDLVARYGGDEFVAVLPGADGEKAHAVAEAMRRRVRETVSGASVSIGVAARLPRDGEAVAQLLSEADEALYRSKQDGRNCVRRFGV
jgi:diguanylate cyclase (GGDEF)-like protein